jgi:glutathione-regulated potassium-efflux system ancillary protein KefF
MHRLPFGEFSPVIEQTALFCGMHWESPLVLHGAHRVAEEALDDAVARYRERLEHLVSAVGVDGGSP